MTRRVYHVPRALVLLQPALAAPGQAEARREIDVTAIPVDVEWTRNDINEADEASITLDWADLPLDPRALRDCRVVIYCADVGSPDRTLAISDRSAVRFIGFVDEAEVDFGGDSERVLLRARDYTGRLIDAKLPIKGLHGRSGASKVRASKIPEGSLRADRPLSEIIKQVLAVVPPYVGAEIEVEDDRSVASVTGKKLWTPPAGVSCWDAIVGLSKELGQTPRWELGRLVVGAPRSVRASEARIVVYGDQVERMTLKRSLNPVAVKRIVFRALDTGSRRVVEGVWPPPGDDRGEVAYTLPAGPWSSDTLKARARQVFTTWERRQVSGSLETAAMSDLDDAGLVGLASGDPIYLRARSTDRARVLGKSRGELAAYLRDRGMAPTTANALAQAWSSSEDLATLFYTIRARHRWTRDDGYRLTVDFGNTVGV